MMESKLPVVLIFIVVAIVVGTAIVVFINRSRKKTATDGYVSGTATSEGETLTSLPILRCLSGEYEGAVIPVDKEIIIGRDPAKASVVLHSIEVSRSHMSIVYQSSSGTFIINDLDSKNGVYVARAEETQFKKVKTTVLRDGDRFIVGLRVAEFELKKQLPDSQTDNQQGD
ncbi:MAG: FHA domain-containing protein [Nitrospirae bacterium]|uniref:FHA domain-containing protein n=1 Tax=Candidatus Magnetobacterium casense TaxID=1455061 RepID=UPI000590045B|nr:FHA domain-containing protein [Candidatus Magnetobacterium casensis]MBF0338049.1 FHA domain-containing protein [Nitrospirota bacterium]